MHRRASWVIMELEVRVMLVEMVVMMVSWLVFVWMVWPHEEPRVRGLPVSCESDWQ